MSDEITIKQLEKYLQNPENVRFANELSVIVNLELESDDLHEFCQNTYWNSYYSIQSYNEEYDPEDEDSIYISEDCILDDFYMEVSEYLKQHTSIKHPSFKIIEYLFEKFDCSLIL